MTADQRSASAEKWMPESVPKLDRSLSAPFEPLGQRRYTAKECLAMFAMQEPVPVEEKPRVRTRSLDNFLHSLTVPSKSPTFDSSIAQDRKRFFEARDRLRMLIAENQNDEAAAASPRWTAKECLAMFAAPPSQEPSTTTATETTATTESTAVAVTITTTPAQQKEETTCAICFDTFRPGARRAMHERGDCGVAVCGECTVAFLRSKIEAKEVSEAALRCPSGTCAELVRPADVRRLIGGGRHAALLRDFLSARAEADQVTAARDARLKRVVPSLGDMAESVRFSLWRSTRDAKRCPGCRMVIEKNGGCQHMTCRNCRHEFWWCCGQAYGERHNEMLCVPIVYANHASPWWGPDPLSRTVTKTAGAGVILGVGAAGAALASTAAVLYGLSLPVKYAAECVDRRSGLRERRRRRRERRREAFAEERQQRFRERQRQREEEEEARVQAEAAELAVFVESFSASLEAAAALGGARSEESDALLPLFSDKDLAVVAKPMEDFVVVHGSSGGGGGGGGSSLAAAADADDKGSSASPLAVRFSTNGMAQDELVADCVKLLRLRTRRVFRQASAARLLASQSRSRSRSRSQRLRLGSSRLNQQHGLFGNACELCQRQRGARDATPRGTNPELLPDRQAPVPFRGSSFSTVGALLLHLFRAHEGAERDELLGRYLEAIAFPDPDDQDFFGNAECSLLTRRPAGADDSRIAAELERIRRSTAAAAADADANADGNTDGNAADDAGARAGVTAGARVYPRIRRSAAAANANAQALGARALAAPLGTSQPPLLEKTSSSSSSSSSSSFPVRQQCRGCSESFEDCVALCEHIAERAPRKFLATLERPGACGVTTSPGFLCTCTACEVPPEGSGTGFCASCNHPVALHNDYVRGGSGGGGGGGSGGGGAAVAAATARASIDPLFFLDGDSYADSDDENESLDSYIDRSMEDLRGDMDFFERPRPRLRRALS